MGNDIPLKRHSAFENCIHEMIFSNRTLEVAKYRLLGLLIESLKVDIEYVSGPEEMEKK